MAQNNSLSSLTLSCNTTLQCVGVVSTVMVGEAMLASNGLKQQEKTVVLSSANVVVLLVLRSTERDEL